MKNDLISVIIPVYKVEKYLDKCVQSVVEQTYKNLEIILVDDGSPDGCPAMCDEWAKKDSRIKVIHKENGGPSDARNVALDIAKGDYIMFLDSDDYVDLKVCEVLLGLSKEHEADVAICNFYQVFENEPFEEKPNKREILKVYERESRFEPLKYFCIQTIVAWGKLYKKNIFKNIRYPKGKLNEDEYVVHKYLYEAKKIVYTSQKLWYYLKREGSIMSRLSKVYEKSNLEPFRERIDYFIEKGVDEDTIAFACTSYLRHLLYGFNKVNITKEDKRYLNSEYKKIFKKINWKYVSFNRKVWIFAYKLFRINLFKIKLFR